MTYLHIAAGSDPLNPVLYANSGGPMSRTRTERVSSTLLGDDDEFIRCPRQMQLGLDFGKADPFECVMSLLRKQGHASPEDLRDVYTSLPAPMLCAVNHDLDVPKVAKMSAVEVLAQAFLLGLCTAVYYDPSRPVIWTHASLTRRLELFDTGGFYA